MKYRLLILPSVFVTLSANAALWTPIEQEVAAKSAAQPAVYQLDEALMKQHVSKAKSVPQRVTLPLPNGQERTFVLTYDPIYSDLLAEQYPNIHTFKGVDEQDPSLTGRFDMTPNGFHAMFHQDGEIIFIDPNTATDAQYNVYQHKGGPRFIDQVKQLPNAEALSEKVAAAKGAINKRTYRLIVATSAEYTAFHRGASLAQAEITTAINRVNQIFERDFAVTLQLVNTKIYSNAFTDPFTNTDAVADIDTVRSLLNTEFGADSYDVGHLFTTGAGGLAYVGSVCADTHKGGGVTGTSSPVGDSYYIDYVSHELGHQFGANHTFNTTDQFCTDQRNNATAYEPGTGSTIMSYAGICGSDNLQANVDPYFHAGSIAQVRNNIANGRASTCGTAQVLNNDDPVVNAGADYTVPAETPLKLSGSATNSGSGDTLSYSWEQMDAGRGASLALKDTGVGPLFRTWPPQSHPERYLPRLSDVIDGSLTVGETYATTDRDMNFRLIVRDANGGVEYDDMAITVHKSAGPFKVIAPVDGNYTGSMTVEWDVAGTAEAPVSCSNVDVMLSSDNGVTFEQTLLAATPNDGSQVVTLPSREASNARVMVRCSDNIFFAVSNRFTVEGTANNAPTASDDGYTIVQRSSAIPLVVLANDSDPDSDPLSIKSITYSGAGTVTINNNQLMYTHAVGFLGTETIGYTISDGHGGEDSATVTITVQRDSTGESGNEGGSGGGGSMGLFGLLLGLLGVAKQRRLN